MLGQKSSNLRLCLNNLIPFTVFARHDATVVERVGVNVYNVEVHELRVIKNDTVINYYRYPSYPNTESCFSRKSKFFN